MVSIEMTAKTAEEAIDLALAELGVDMDEVECEILSSGSKGLLGFGSKPAKVRLTTLNEWNANKEKAAQELAAAEAAAAAKKAAAAAAKEEKVAEPKAQPLEQPKPAAAAQAAPKVAAAPTPQAARTGAPTTAAQAGSVNRYRENGELNTVAVQAAVDNFLQPIFKSLEVAPACKMEVREEVIWFIFTGKGLGTIIGRRGETLDSLQYLTNLAVNMGLSREEKLRIVIDVEGYRSNRADTLSALALKMAEKVRKTGHDVILEPMSPHERRVIHMALQDMADIKTYSQGEEPYRKVVISKK